MSTPLSEALRRVASLLAPQRDAIVESWLGALSASDQEADRAACGIELDALLSRLAGGDLDVYLQEQERDAAEQARVGGSFLAQARAIRILDRCLAPFVLQACPEPVGLAEALAALDELADRRLEILLEAQEEEAARRLVEAQEQAARANDRTRELARANDELRRLEARHQHRADQIMLLTTVVHRIAGILEPERLLQEAADAIRGRMNHTFVAVVVLDDEGVLVGRWAGRPGVGRRSAGRTQGPPGGLIGRALRKRAPQVVADVNADADYHADVEITCSEMVIPLLEAGEPIGAIDFQAERPDAFDLDDVAVGETLAEFLVVALRNARLFADARRAR